MSCIFDGVHSHQCRSHNNSNAICVLFFSSLLFLPSSFLLPFPFFFSFLHHPPNPLPPHPLPSFPSLPSFPYTFFFLPFIFLLVLRSFSPVSVTHSHLHSHLHSRPPLQPLTLILLSPQPLAVSSSFRPWTRTSTQQRPFFLFLFSLALLTYKTSIFFPISYYTPRLYLQHINNRPWLALSNSLRRSLQLGSLLSVDASPPVENNKLCCIL